MGSQDDNLKLSTTERAKAMVTAKESAEAMTVEGMDARERGGSTGISADEALKQAEKWPAAPKGVAKMVIEHYGPPHEMTPTKMYWYRSGPWAQMELTADEVLHNFPTPHTDFFAQFVEYPVPVDKIADVAKFDGSLILNRTAGQIGSRCDNEAANTLTLNVLVDFLEGKRGLDESRQFLADNLAAYGLGQDAPYAEQLQFTPRTGFDPDTGIIDESVGKKLEEIAKEG